MSLTRRSLLSQAVWLAGGVGAVWVLREQVLWPTPRVHAQTGVPPWLPFAHGRNHMATVTVEARGARFPALIDTGAQRSAIDRAFAERLSLGGFPLPMVAYGVSGQAQLGQGARFDVDVGGLSVRGLTVAILELGPLASLVNGLGTPLILGQDVLQAAVAEIDYPGMRLRLLPAEGYALPDGARLAPARRQGRALYTTVEIDGRPVEGLVDTGASAALSLRAASPAAAGLPPAARSERSVVLGGTVESAVVENQTLVWAGKTLRGLDVRLHPEVARLPRMPGAIVGAELFGRTPVSLDLAQGRLALLES